MRNNLPSRDHPFVVGDLAPNFTLPDQNRQDWNLASHIKQGDVLLSFVPFAFTGVCSIEMKCISADIATWSKKGATVVAIDCDSFAANKAWAERDGYTHTILGDLHRDVVKAYGLLWTDLNVSQRATILFPKDPSGAARVKFIETRAPGKAMNWDDVLAML